RETVLAFGAGVKVDPGKSLLHTQAPYGPGQCVVSAGRWRRLEERLYAILLRVRDESTGCRLGADLLDVPGPGEGFYPRHAADVVDSRSGSPREIGIRVIGVLPHRHRGQPVVNDLHRFTWHAIARGEVGLHRRPPGGT